MNPLKKISNTKHFIQNLIPKHTKMILILKRIKIILIPKIPNHPTRNLLFLKSHNKIKPMLMKFWEENNQEGRHLK